MRRGLGADERRPEANPSVCPGLQETPRQRCGRPHGWRAQDKGIWPIYSSRNSAAPTSFTCWATPSMTKSAWSISKRLVRTRTFIATLSARRLAGIGGRCGGTVRNTHLRTVRNNLLRAGNLVGVLNSWSFSRFLSVLDFRWVSSISRFHLCSIFGGCPRFPTRGHGDWSGAAAVGLLPAILGNSPGWEQSGTPTCAPAT